MGNRIDTCTRLPCRARRGTGRRRAAVALAAVSLAPAVHSPGEGAGRAARCGRAAPARSRRQRRGAAGSTTMNQPAATLYQLFGAIGALTRLRPT